jgi:hypothetical protein
MLGTTAVGNEIKALNISAKKYQSAESKTNFIQYSTNKMSHLKAQRLKFDNLLLKHTGEKMSKRNGYGLPANNFFCRI